MSRAPLRIALAAGEASGDTLGAGLIEALGERIPGSEFFGIAGPKMTAAGCDAWHHTDELSVMGLSEVVRHLPRLIRLRRRFIDRLLGARPDVFIGIDSPDFNLPVEAAVRRAGIRSVQYVSPQVWAWRQSRVGGIRESTDLVLCLLPFEADFYAQHGVSAVFVGHPLADEIALEVDTVAARAKLGLDPGDKVLALLPGSRTSEVTRLAKPFVETAAWLQRRHPGLRVVAAITDEKRRETFIERTGDIALDPPVQSVIGDARAVMAASDAVLTASGTASLETALHKRPMVVAYIISGLTHRLLRFMGLNELEYFSLPNLLAGRGCVAEYLQRDVRADVLGPALERYLESESEVEGLRETFLSLHSTLRCNASQRAAAAIANLLDGVTSDH